MPLFDYRPEDVQVTFGPVLVSGFGSDTFISVEQNEESFALHVGADGPGTRAKSNNRSARVTVTVAQSSIANDELSALHNLDINGAGDGVQPLSIVDLSGRTVLAAEKAWIVGMPSQEFGRETSEREWVFETDNLVQFAGGN